MSEHRKSSPTEIQNDMAMDNLFEKIDPSIIEEYRSLLVRIDAADTAYHSEGKPVMEDAEYDKLRRKLEQLENKYQTLSSRVSAQVGAAPSRKFSRIQHSMRMLSLRNVFSEEELNGFIQSIHRFLKMPEGLPIGFIGETKIDGLSLSLRYEGKKLVNRFNSW